MPSPSPTRDRLLERGGGGGSVRTISRVGVWVEKLGYDECKCSHDMSGEWALQSEDGIETKPTIESLVE